MGRHHEDGYSADVEAFLVVSGQSLRLAKTNGDSFVLSEACELVPGTSGELVVIIDGQRSSNLVALPDGVTAGQTIVKYDVVAPF